MNEFKDNPFFTKVELFKRDYSNGVCKRIGITVYHNDKPYYIGRWFYFDSNGKQTKIEEFDLDANLIRVNKF